MLQSRRQDLEAQTRGLHEEVERGQGRLRTAQEELMLLRREKREQGLEVTGSWELGGAAEQGQVGNHGGALRKEVCSSHLGILGCRSQQDLKEPRPGAEGSQKPGQVCGCRG